MMRQNKGRSRPDDLRRRIVLLNDEIGKLEQVLQSSGSGDSDLTDAAVRRLRASIVHEELVRKRAELATMVTEGRAAGVDVDQALREAPPSRIAPSVTRSRPNYTAAERRRKSSNRLPMAAAVLAVVLVVGGASALAVSLIGGRGASTGTGPRTAVAGPLSQPLLLAPQIESVPIDEKGETFFSQEFEFTFSAGRVILSGDPAPDTTFSVDDGLRLQITHADGTTANWTRDFNTGCIRNTFLPPQDITNLFRAGLNRVNVTMYDICGENRGSAAALWLSNRD